MPPPLFTEPPTHTYTDPAHDLIPARISPPLCAAPCPLILPATSISRLCDPPFPHPVSFPGLCICVRLSVCPMLVCHTRGLHPFWMSSRSKLRFNLRPRLLFTPHNSIPLLYLPVCVAGRPMIVLHTQVCTLFGPDVCVNPPGVRSALPHGRVSHPIRTNPYT